MAGGGRVDEDQVGGAGPLERLDLAEHEDVLHAGDGGRHHVERARVDEPLRDPPQPVGLEVLDEGGVGGEGRARTPGSSSALVVVDDGQPNIDASPDLPSTSTTSTLSPARAAATASAAVTVVFPTPPLPATMTTWEVEQKLRDLHRLHATRAMRAVCGRAAAVRGARARWRGLGCCARPRRRGRAASPAGTRDRRRAGRGLLDPANAALVRRRDREANERGSTMLVLQLDVGRARSTSTSRDRAGDHGARNVPIGVWVGPSGSNARGRDAARSQSAHRRLRLAGRAASARRIRCGSTIPAIRAPATGGRPSSARSRRHRAATPTARRGSWTDASRPARPSAGRDRPRRADPRRAHRRRSTARRWQPRRADVTSRPPR